MLKHLEEVYKYYQTIAQSYQDKGLRILKTDTHNESGTWAISIPLAPILAKGNTLTCIEIDPGTLARAQGNFPDLDLRAGNALTWEGEYDVVLDFSTIDHIEDYRKALENYKKLAPKLSCIVWLHETQRKDDSQFWFCEKDFKQVFQDIWGEHESKPIFGGSMGTLHHFVCPGNT